MYNCSYWDDTLKHFKSYNTIPVPYTNALVEECVYWRRSILDCTVKRRLSQRKIEFRIILEVHRRD